MPKQGGFNKKNNTLFINDFNKGHVYYEGFCWRKFSAGK
jgi:hypothetical protein